MYKKLFYKPIYCLSSIKQKTLKIDIKTRLKTRFIWLTQFFIDALIFFSKKLDRTLRLCVHYQDHIIRKFKIVISGLLLVNS